MCLQYAAIFILIATLSGQTISVPRSELVACVRIRDLSDHSECLDALWEYVDANYSSYVSECSEKEVKYIRRKLHGFLKTFNRYWIQCSRNYVSLERMHPQWLSGSITLLGSSCDFSTPCRSGVEVNETLGSNEAPSSSFGVKRGRPSKEFHSCGVKSKRRKVDGIVSENSLAELCLATEQKLRKSGKRDAANIVKNITLSPKRATNIKKLFEAKNSKKPSSYTPDESLSMIISAQMTKHQYMMLRSGALDKGVNLYPSYVKVIKAKKSCYPPTSEIIVNDTMAEIKLQALVDLTIKRFFLNQNLIEMTNSSNKFTITFKWGCDGCGGLNRYKQSGSEVNVVNDSSVLSTSVVPINIMSDVDKNKPELVWQNPRTSSTRFCRPVRFQFIAESADVIQQEISYIEDQIKELRPTELEVEGRKVSVSSNFLLTLVDGKVCNAIAHNTSSQKCYICGGTPKIMNNLVVVRQKTCDEESVSWGISSLHAYIRFMECFLHISYKLGIKKWQARTKEDKQLVEDRKKEVIQAFRNKTGLLLDTPKQGGGNTNDGNSARRFFRNAELAASITGVDQRLIERCGVILKAVSSGHELDAQNFERYASETADLFVSLYHWYPMPVTVHKILIHGVEIVKRFFIPIGQLSEDVQEIRHKDFKKYREHFSRKTSRIDTNRDILNRLLVSSDPFITSFQRFHPPNRKDLGPEVLMLLKNQPQNFEEDIVESDGDGSELSFMSDFSNLDL